MPISQITRKRTVLSRIHEPTATEANAQMAHDEILPILFVYNNESKIQVLPLRKDGNDDHEAVGTVGSLALGPEAATDGPSNRIDPGFWKPSGSQQQLAAVTAQAMYPGYGFVASGLMALERGWSQAGMAQTH